MLLAVAEKTRPVLWHMSTGLEVLWYTLAVASVFVFAYGVARPLAKYRRGRAIGLPPRAELPGRFKQATKTLFSHSSIARRDPLAGWAHRGTFYGFLVLFIGTVILAIDTDIVHRIFGASYFKGNFYLVYSIVLDLFGLALVGGLAVLMIRRGILRPRKLDYARPDRAPGEG
jgi:hypothetical protein